MKSSPPLMKSKEDSRIFAGGFAVLPKGTPFEGFVMEEPSGALSHMFPASPRLKSQVADRDFVIWVDMAGSSRGKPYVSWDGGNSSSEHRDALREVNFEAVAEGSAWEMFPSFKPDGNERALAEFAEEAAAARRSLAAREDLAAASAKLARRRLAGEEVSPEEAADLIKKARGG